MKNYSEFPPIKHFIRVLKNCPKSALLYAQLFQKYKNKSFTIMKIDTRRDFLVTPTIFRNLLTPLVSLNLIFLKESDISYHIDMLGNNFDD